MILLFNRLFSCLPTDAEILGLIESHSGCIHHELRGLGCGSSRIEEKQTSSPPRWSPPQSGAVITVQPVGGRTKTNATGHCRSMSDQSMTLQTLTKIARELNSAHQVTPSSNSSGSTGLPKKRKATGPIKYSNNIELQTLQERKTSIESDNLSYSGDLVSDDDSINFGELKLLSSSPSASSRVSQRTPTPSATIAPPSTPVSGTSTVFIPFPIPPPLQF